jgi:hypothetical protein
MLPVADRRTRAMSLAGLRDQMSNDRLAAARGAKGATLR